jgi:hypothetical protein
MTIVRWNGKLRPTVPVPEKWIGHQPVGKRKDRCVGGMCGRVGRLRPVGRGKRHNRRKLLKDGGNMAWRSWRVPKQQFSCTRVL